MEERDDGRAPEATDADAVAARTRALVEESRQLLQRLERLIGRNAPGDDDAGAQDDGGDNVDDTVDDAEQS